MTPLKKKFLVAVVLLKLLMQLVELGFVLFGGAGVDLAFGLEFLEDSVSLGKGL